MHLFSIRQLRFVFISKNSEVEKSLSFSLNFTVNVNLVQLFVFIKILYPILSYVEQLHLSENSNLLFC